VVRYQCPSVIASTTAPTDSVPAAMLASAPAKLHVGRLT